MRTRKKEIHSKGMDRIQQKQGPSGDFEFGEGQGKYAKSGSSWWKREPRC